MNLASNNSHHDPSVTTETGVDQQRKKHEGLRSFLSAMTLMASALLIAFSVAAFVVQSYQVDGDSMEMTLQNNDRLIVNKVPRTISRITDHPYVPNRGDIIVFNQSGIFDSGSAEKKQLIKRVIGLPGERVLVNNGGVTVFNQTHPFGFNPDTEDGYSIGPVTTPGKVDVTLGRNEIFVAGDNRPNSEDSRYFGAVDVDNIVGKLVIRIMPIDKIQRF